MIIPRCGLWWPKGWMPLSSSRFRDHWSLINHIRYFTRGCFKSPWEDVKAHLYQFCYFLNSKPQVRTSWAGNYDYNTWDQVCVKLFGFRIITISEIHKIVEIGSWQKLVHNDYDAHCLLFIVYIYIHGQWLLAITFTVTVIDDHHHLCSEWSDWEAPRHLQHLHGVRVLRPRHPAGDSNSHWRKMFPFRVLLLAEESQSWFWTERFPASTSLL